MSKSPPVHARLEGLKSVSRRVEKSEAYLGVNAHQQGIAFPRCDGFNLASDNEKDFIFSVDQNLGTPTFRYMQKEYYDLFVETGQLRLSTLWSYHDEQTLGSEQGDNSEGFRSFHSHLDKLAAGNLRGFMHGSAVNQWAMCTTNVRNERFYEEFKANCCIEISSLNFYAEVAIAARHSAAIGLLCGVQYVDSAELIRKHMAAINEGRVWRPPFFPATKPRRYAWQSEVRLLLEPPPRGELRNFDTMNPKRRKQLMDEAQVAVLQGREHILRNRPELHHDLPPLIVEAPAALQYTRLVETM